MEAIQMNIWYFKGQASPEALSSLQEKPTEGFIWINSQLSELDKVLDILKSRFDIVLHEEHVDDCRVVANHPSFFDAMKNYSFLIFHSLQKITNSSKIKTNSVVFILSANLLVTLHEEDQTVDRMEKRVIEEARQNPESPAILLYLILDAIIDNLMSYRELLTDKFVYWQGVLLDERGRFSNWVSLLDYKTNIERLRMLCETQQDVINQWRQSIHVSIDDPFNIRLNDLNEHIVRVKHFIEQLESQVDSLMQLHYSLVNNRTGDIVRLLTVISCIFLPLTLVTGIFGMNFKYMSFLDKAYAYPITMVSMLSIAIILLIIFRFKKWI